MRRKYVSGSSVLTDDQANEIGYFLEKVGGFITPKSLLDLARDPACPMHGFFDWDDAKAAEKYRLWQARKMIAAICIVSDGGEKVRTWHSLTIEDQKQYVEAEEIRKAPSLVDQVLEHAFNELTRWRERYGAYKEFFNVTTAIDNLVEAQQEKTNGEEKTRAERTNDRGVD